MTDVMAIPPDVFYNPDFFDMNLLLPLWVWIIFIMVFVGFVMILGMVYIWLVMRPVSGYGSVGDSATAKGSPTQVFSIWKNRSFVIESMWYYGNILAYGNPLKQMQMWFHNSEKATGVSASKPVMITRDGFDGTVDFVAEMAVCEIPRIFNEEWGFELVPKTDPNGFPLKDEQGEIIMVPTERVDSHGEPFLISKFSDIRKRLPVLEKLYPDGVRIKIYNLYDLAQIYQYTPQGEDSLEFGGVMIDDAKEWLRDEEKPEKGFIEKNALLIICMMVGIISTAFVFIEFPVK